MALAPVKASMQIFDRVGMAALREKSVKLTGYLEWLIAKELAGKIEVLTPREPEQRGAQLSLVVKGATRDVEARLHGEGVVVDFREPNVIRVAPAPLYNSFRDVWELVKTLRGVLG
jgi:kynureninase